MKVIVAGAGIAGLAAAIAFALKGADVEVYEQAPDLKEIGAGLQISPNGWRVLVALGVAERLEGQLFEPEAIELRMGAHNRSVFRLEMKARAKERWGARYVHIQRADLHDALRARLKALAPGVVRLGVKIAGYDQFGDKTRLMVKEDDALQCVSEGNILIGADGLHSVIRAQMLGEGPARYTGNVAWRAILPDDGRFAQVPPTACVWAGWKSHVVTTRLRAGSMVNLVGMVETPLSGEESWHASGDRSEALAHFGDWPVVGPLFEQAQTLNRWALFDRPAYPRWSDGHAVLIGDAAHPMLPSMAQGAVQALEDTWLLSDMLTEPVEVQSSVSERLHAFYAARIERVTRIQQMSRSNAHIFHKAAPFFGDVFYTGINLAARLKPSAFMARQDWIYGYDPISRSLYNRS